MSSNTSQKENVTFFKGVEVEHTPAYGLLTLFVVGIQDPQEVINKADLNECRNIYLGANQDAIITGKNLGIADNSCCTYSATPGGLEAAMRNTSNAINRSRDNEEEINFTQDERHETVNS